MIFKLSELIIYSFTKEINEDSILSREEGLISTASSNNKLSLLIIINPFQVYDIEERLNFILLIVR